MKNVCQAAFAAIVFTLFSQYAFAGPLNPPGPPTAGTMKPLSEVEPRIPIRQSDMPLTISTPGSYYLTQDVTAAQTAITVAADHVTIDLCGFSVIGSNNAFAGLYLQGHGNVELCNGTIRGFLRGISATSTNDKNLRIINLRVMASSGEGIYCLGQNVRVENCLVSGVGDETSNQAVGIYVGPNSAVINSQVTDIGNLSSGTTANGIKAAQGSRVSGNTVSLVGSTVQYAYGIKTGVGCTVTGNTVVQIGDSATANCHGIYSENGNTISGNTVSNNGENANTVTGIRGFTACLICDNVSFLNGGHANHFTGIYGGSGSNVSNNTTYNNGIFATNGYGLFGNPASRVVGNSSYGNGSSSTGTVFGICTGIDCLVDQNISYGNGGTNMNQLSSCTYGTNHAP